MRPILLSLTALAGLATAGLFNTASAAPLDPAYVQHVQFYEGGYGGDDGGYGPYEANWREREWRHHEWERHRRWEEHRHWHDERRGW